MSAQIDGELKDISSKELEILDRLNEISMDTRKIITEQQLQSGQLASLESRLNGLAAQIDSLQAAVASLNPLPKMRS